MPQVRLIPTSRTLALTGGFALPMVPFAGFCAVHYAQRVEAGRGSEHWPHVRGVITESKVVHSRDYDDSEIRYEYVVDGASYIARRIEFGHSTLGSLGNARRDVQKYKVGREVTVYYKPGDPQTAVLEPGTGTAHNMFYSSGGLTILLAIVAIASAVVLVVRRRRVALR